MTLPKLIFISLFFCFTRNTFGQQKFFCKLDTFEIVTNQHLDDFLYKLQFDSIKEYRKTSAIPPFIKKSLDCLTGGDFSLGEPFEEFRSTCTSPLHLPRRQLKYLGLSKNLLAMVYLTGGIAEETHIILITYYGETILDIWEGSDINGKVRNRSQMITFLKKARTKKFNDFGYL